MIAALNSASYGYSQKLRELETQFEQKAGALREGYIAEIVAIHGGSGAD